MIIAICSILGTAVLCRIAFLLLSKAPAGKGIDLDALTVQKAIESKKKLRDRHLSGGLESKQLAASNLPPGQFLAKKWVVLDLGMKPDPLGYDPWKDGDDFKIKVCGVEGGMKELSVGEMKKMGPRVVNGMTWHCVTGWSTLGLGFYGIPMSRLIKEVKPRGDWECLWQVSADGYTVPIMREDLEADVDSLLVLGDMQEEVLSLEHGGIRIFAPSLFGWKSAKFLSEIHFLPHYQKGFWENLGCHQRGRVMSGERWSVEAKGIWQWLIWLSDQYRIFMGPQVYYFNLWIGSTVLGWFSNLFGLLGKDRSKQE